MVAETALWVAAGACLKEGEYLSENDKPNLHQTDIHIPTQKSKVLLRFEIPTNFLQAYFISNIPKIRLERRDYHANLTYAIARLSVAFYGNRPSLRLI